MEQSAMSELIKAYEATLDKGVTGLLILVAVAIVIATLAYFWTKRTAYKAEVNKGNFDTALTEMFAETLAQHRADTTAALDRNTVAWERNIETRESYTLAFNKITSSLEGVSTVLSRLDMDFNSRQSLMEGTVSGLDTRVQTLIGAVSALDLKVERVSLAVNALPHEYAQTAALVRGVAAEFHQLNDLIISTLRPPKNASDPTPPALQTTLTPETSE